MNLRAVRILTLPSRQASNILEGGPPKNIPDTNMFVSRMTLTCASALRQLLSRYQNASCRIAEPCAAP